MKLRDILEFIALGAIWGASFLFMRIATPQFGPIALIAVRVTIAALALSAALAWRGELALLRGHVRDFVVVGSVNSALPFTLFAYATLSLSAGYSSVLNATAPLFGAALGWLVWRERLSLRRSLGLAVGFGGVLLLVWHKLAPPGDRRAVLAGLVAALGYGFAAHHSKRHLASVPPLVVATGTQIAASALLVPLALANLPPQWPSATGFACALALGVVCTGLAYALYFRSIAHLGAGRAMTVAYLIPVFGILWGFLFLEESIQVRTLLGGGVILLGVMQVVRAGPNARPAPSAPSLASPTPCPKSPTRTAP